MAIFASFCSLSVVCLTRSAACLVLLSLLPCVANADESAPVEPASYLDSTKVDLMSKIQGHLFNEQYPKADSVSRYLIHRYPDDPAGYCFRAVGMLNEMFDREENLYGEQFKLILDTVETRAAKMKQGASGQRAAWMCLWIGHAKAHRALWETKFGSSARAARLGLQVGGEYREGLKYDSTVEDIYAGLGAFHYWKSEKAGLLRMIRIFNDDRAKGVAQLYRASQKGILSQSAARHALAWIYVNEDSPDSVLAICQELSEKYPMGKVFLWPVAEAMMKAGRWTDALFAFSQLQERFASDPGNYFNLIECDYQIFKCQSVLGREIDAESTTLRVGTYVGRIPERTRDRQGGKIREMARFLSDRLTSVSASAP
jgi:hypothetical protein